MVIAGHSRVKTEKFAFTQRIEKFSWQLRRGGYESSTYYCKLTDSTWILIIESNRDVIKIILRRKDYKKECQSISVHLAIVDSFNISPFYAAKEIDFTPRFNEEIVLCVTKKDLFEGYYGLNKVRFVPNDALTLKCEITSYETIEANYASEDEFEDAKETVRNEIHEWLLLLLGDMVVLGSIIYICLGFVMPFIGRFLSMPGIFYVLVAIFFISILFFTLIFLIKAMNGLWYRVKPGGDRTYLSLCRSTQMNHRQDRATEQYSSGVIIRFMSIRYVYRYLDSTRYISILNTSTSATF